MSKRSSFSWGVLLIEMASITLAVVLGFMLSEWRVSRTNAQLAHGALEAIATEVRFNREQIGSRMVYFRSIVQQVDSLRSARPGMPVTTGDLQGWRGAAPPLLRRASYEAAVATGAFNHIPFGTTNDIATVYAAQGYLENVVSAVVDRFMDPSATSLEGIVYTFRVFMDMTPELLNLYAELESTHLAGH